MPIPVYHTEVDQIKKDEWSEIIQHFEDASVYQTWSYGAVRWGENKLSHLVLKKNGVIVAAVQARILQFPLFQRGIAYIRWGPMWRLRGKERDLDSLGQMARALVEEYVVRRSLFIRVLPNEIEGEGDAVRQIFEAEGFRWKQSSYRTLILDLAPSLESLRKGLRKVWRYNLNKAEKQAMNVIEGTNDNLFEIFMTLYNQMLLRKRFLPGVDINEFRDIQKDLPNPLKMKIFIGKLNEEAVGGLVGSLLGNTGIYVLGATGEKGLKLQSSYLIQWRMIQWLRESGARYYDLNGFDPDSYPGTAFFKAGLPGKDVYHIGEFEASRSLISSFLVKSGDQVRTTSLKIKFWFNKMRNRFIT
ncbi:MAG: GNAT family N-acetyltransferase [Candidatus Helarchaeota archaeon]|nr:GNAT family N-acetyltransferase [Candidatus Helarchaeota archaeon]